MDSALGVGWPRRGPLAGAADSSECR
eukprot:ctg_2724.g582